jgi:hypothetical protein
LLSKGLIDVTGKGKAKAFPQDVNPLEDLFGDHQVEIVRSAKSLMKHALMRSGSRDVRSRLFAALCRALGIPAYLVVSLQSVPWQTFPPNQSGRVEKRQNNYRSQQVTAPELPHPAPRPR